jgi:tetratricopeptide (TPR) repeat protein
MLVKNERSSDINNLITRSYQLFEVGNFVEARGLLDEAHKLDYEDPEIRSALRACGYWSQRQKSLEGLNGDGPRGDYLRRQWCHYVTRYKAGFDHPLEEGTTRLRKWVHNEALSYYLRQVSESSDPEALLQAGRCRKVLGRFEECITTLEETVRLMGNSDSRLLAELADTYALVGESEPAKVLMREALFIDAGKVELDEIVSPLFRRLIDRLCKERDMEDPGFQEWLPVYGAIWGVLDVKRELSPVEYGKLKQTIYALKSEIADGDKQGILTPKLINHYFRMIDHYQSTGGDRSAIDEVLINIKLLSPAIYRKNFE